MPAPTTPVVVRGPGRQVRAGPTRVVGPTWQGLGAFVPPEPITATTISYVRKTGSDSNGGTSPSDAWLTIQHALSTVSIGTAIYIGAGVYRETLSITPSPTPGSPLWLIGDVDGARTGDAGMVQVTGYTTSDKTAPSATNLIAFTGSSNITLMNLYFVGGNSNNMLLATAISQNIAIKNCAFHAGNDSTLASTCMTITGQFGTPLNWLIDSCWFVGGEAGGVGVAVSVTLPGSAAGSDYDGNVVIRNSTFLGWFNQIVIQGSGGTTFRGGGVRISNCFFAFAVNDAVILAATTSTTATYPVTVMNSVFYAITAAAINGRTAGLLVEDYNQFNCAAKSGTIGGAHSVSSIYAPLWHFGQEAIWGGTRRALGEPMQSSPLNDFGNDGKQSPLDARLGPRPTGLTAPAVGPYERSNNMAEETSVVAHGYSVTGDGFQDFDIAVDSGAISFSVFCQSDSSYTGQPPSLSVLPNAECGVGSAETCAKLQAQATREQLAVTIKPTTSGIVTVRFTSRDQSGLSKVVFDTFAAA